MEQNILFQTTYERYAYNTIQKGHFRHTILLTYKWAKIQIREERNIFANGANHFLSTHMVYDITLPSKFKVFITISFFLPLCPFRFF